MMTPCVLSVLSTPPSAVTVWLHALHDDEGVLHHPDHAGIDRQRLAGPPMMSGRPAMVGLKRSERRSSIGSTWLRSASLRKIRL
jgi:hypothetical protein